MGTSMVKVASSVTDATLGEISRGTGISVSHLSRIFNNERSPSLTKLTRIAAYMGMSVGDLVNEIADGKMKTTNQAV